MHTTLSAFLLLPVFAQAQDPLSDILKDHLYFGPAQYESAQDSADFVQFRQGLRIDDLALLTDTIPVPYRMVWHETQRGGLWLVTRGDGSQLPDFPAVRVAVMDWMGSPYRTADGRHGVIHVWEEPCGLICRDVWYYEEE